MAHDSDLDNGDGFALASFATSRPRLLDLGIALLWALNFAISFVFFRQGAISLGSWTLLPLLATAILFRRANPYVALLVVTLAPPILRFAEFGTMRDPSPTDYLVAPGAVAPTEYLDLAALAIILYTLAANVRPWRAAAGLAFSGGVVAGAVALFAYREGILGNLVLIEMLLVVVLLIGMNVRSHRQRIRAYELRAQQFELEQDQRAQLAVSRERARIAREMHDVVAHSLSVMVSLADGALASLDRNPEGSRRAVDELANVGRSALADTRRLVGVLRDDAADSGDTHVQVEGAPLTPQPTTADIEHLIDRFRSTGLNVRFIESGPQMPSDAGLHLTVYRIVQEALTNVLRHDPTSPLIEVRIARTYRTVVVTVTNRAGDGSSAERGSGKGLIGMRERAAVYGGTVEAGPTDDGWEVRAELNWQENE